MVAEIDYRAKWLPRFLRKRRPFIMNICPCGPYTPTYGAYYHCEYVDDKYLSPYQTRAHWLSWLPRKSRACKFKFRPLGPITFTLLGLDYQKAHQGPMGYQCAVYGLCGYCSSVARGDRRRSLQETEETTKIK